MKPFKVAKRRRDKSDHATFDKVLDKKTLRILGKLCLRGKLFDLQGSLCTGKEANVYLANASTDLQSKFIRNENFMHQRDTVNSENKNEIELSMKSDSSVNIEKMQSIVMEKISALYVAQKEDVQGSLESSSCRALERESTNACDIQGCVDTMASTSTTMRNGEVIPVAIKIYKTSIMAFKDREKYVRNEIRFQNFCTSNPRKLIKLWAEKEVRNLKRLNKHNIPSPRPIYLRNNILIMSLIGTRDNVAQKLKDAEINDYADCYNQCIEIIKLMYIKANLIHADFSEYNLLWHNNTVFVIDLGQSIEKSHVNANKFLIMDLNNINSFFVRRGVETTSTNELFEEITGFRIPFCLKEVKLSGDSFIPSRIDEVANYEDFESFSKKRHIENHWNNAPELYAQDEHESKSCDSGEDEFRSNMEKEAQSDPCCNKGLSLENRSSCDARLIRKENKKITKEANKERRAARITKKEKYKIYKKYLRKNGRK